MTCPDPVQNPSSSCWSYFLFFIFKLCGGRCPATSNNWSLSASGGPPTLEIQKRKPIFFLQVLVLLVLTFSNFQGKTSSIRREKRKGKDMETSLFTLTILREIYY